MFADFFTTAIHAKFYFIVPSMFFVYSSTFMLWATIYYITWMCVQQAHTTCMSMLNHTAALLHVSILAAAYRSTVTLSAVGCWQSTTVSLHVLLLPTLHFRCCTSSAR